MFENVTSNFEELSILAKENPEAFEALRSRLCEQILKQAPEHMRRRLYGLQFKIDMERRRSKTALSSCLKISRMMNDSLLELHTALSNPTEFLRTHQQNITPSENVQSDNKHTTAEIIPLFPEHVVQSKC